MKVVRSKRSRYIFALMSGLIVGTLTLIFGKLEFVPLATWDAAALTILLIIILDMRGADAKRTSMVARRDDMTHSLSDVIVLIASIASIAAVIYMVMSGDASVLHIVVGLVSIVISWATVHTLYALRYAVMYYSDPEGGIDFNDKSKPRFSDFVYISYTIGMTYQVSDTSLENADFRHVAWGHAVLSFIFGTSIIATTINFLVSLGK